jgi:thioredoxin-like negative regulator of GroEL
MGTKPGLYKKGGRHESDKVLDLDPDTFADTLLNSDAVWVVEFYSDKCPICNSLAPQYIKAAEAALAESDGKLRFAAVNSRVYHTIAEPFGITSYPWVTSFYMGRNIEHMAGMGGWESFYNWGKKHRDNLWKEENKGKTSTHFISQEGLEGEPHEENKLEIVLPPAKEGHDEL